MLANVQALTESGFLNADDTTKVENIVTAVNNTVLNNQSIALTAKHQTIAVSLVVSAMNELNEGAVQTACGISQTKIGVQRFNEAALNLQAIV